MVDASPLREARESAHVSSPSEPKGQSDSVISEPSKAEIPEPVRDEEKVLERVTASLRARTLKAGKRDYDAELIALRDELAEARLEDAPPLLAQMERLQAVAARRQEVTEGVLDARSPYFAHMRLRENGKLRDVCLGRATYLDAEHGVRVVDWRNAPVSRIYYRYAEGDPYEEQFGEKDVEGEVLVRRDVTITSGRLVRVGGSQATYVRRGDGTWRTLSLRSTRLAGGQGTSALPDNEAHRARGVLGEGHGEEGLGRRDRFLPEIAALLDPKQFEAISRPAAGVVVIQGGAGSGKTTVGLHRIAYLAFQAPKRFTAERVLVMVPNRALATYTSRVLPALEVPDVTVAVLPEWQREARVRSFPSLPSKVSEETPLAVVKLKRHPTLLLELERRVDALVSELDVELRAVCARAPEAIAAPILAAWKALAKSALFGRVMGVRRWMQGALSLPGVPASPPDGAQRVPIEQALVRMARRAKDVLSLWADLLTDRQALAALAGKSSPSGLAPLSASDVEQAIRWCTRRCESVLGVAHGVLEERDKARAKARERREERERSGRSPRDDERDGRDGDEAPGQQELFGGGGGLGDDDGAMQALDQEQLRPRKRRDDEEHRAAYRDDDDDGGPDEDRFRAVDGRTIEEEEELANALDAEDDAILLRLHQRMRGPLHGKGKAPLAYEHVFVDELQDCAAIDLAVLVECTNVVGGERSMTLAGDTAQRLTLDTGLGHFAPALEQLGLPHVEVEPLQIGYRSTRQVLELAREILGPLAPATPPVAPRDGAPVETHRFSDQGAAAAFLASALRDLSAREPLASVALIARHAWQADVYHDVLSRAEIPNLRRVRDQDFSFRAGVDLTDVKQVKGLEWDYVVLLDVNAQSYGDEDEARHLLHIASTRAAHQLWLIASGEPSPLVLRWEV
jgi:DNA helicase-2/ATP-dependent DNA helicase PcrA